MTTESLAGVKKIFIHARCPDGAAAAMICAAAYASGGMRPDLEFVQYGTDAHAKLEPGPGQMFVDITPPIPRWKEWEPFAPVVLDHHKTARPVTEGLGGIYGGPDECGATLAYDHVHKALGGEWECMAELARLSMIRDTWKNQSPDWAKACALAMALNKADMDGILDACRDGAFDDADLTGLIASGVPMYEAEVRKNKKYVKGAHPRQFLVRGKEYRIAYFNCTEPISDPANDVLADGHDMVVGFFLLQEDGMARMVVSLRTNGALDAAKIAEVHGGGGHERAAGFRIDKAEDIGLSQVVSAVSRGIWQSSPG